MTCEHMTSVPSLHDSRLSSYEVDAKNRQITLRTEFETTGTTEKTDVIFYSVAAYHFENDSFATILYDIEETDPLELVEQNAQLFSARHKTSGWPGPWAETLEKAKDYVRNEKLRAFDLLTTTGMSGWVLAKSYTLSLRA